MAAEHANRNLPALIDEIGVSKSTINRWTRDDGKLPTRPNLRAWADFCGVDYDWLASGEGTVVVPMPVPSRDKHDAAADAAFDRWEQSEPTTTTQSDVRQSSCHGPCK